MGGLGRVWSVTGATPTTVAPPPRPVAARARPGTGAWLAGGAVLAAAGAVDPWGLRPFTSLRWSLVSVLVLAGLVGTGGRGSTGRALPRWVVAAGGVLLASMALSAVWALDPASAWLGHGRRHLGVAAWAVLAGAAVLGARLASDPSACRTVARSAWLAGAATAATGIADWAGWSPLGTEFAGGRVGGLLGQPTTLGALGVLLLPLAAAAPAPRWARATVTAGLGATVLATQTRGAVLGVVAVAVLVLAGRGTPSRRLLVVAVVLGAAVVASPAGSRLLDAGDSGRLDDWALAADVIGDRPLLGTGPEGYRVAVVGAIDDAYVADHGRDVVVDRAHAAPLDVAATGGIAAGAAYLTLVAGVAVAAWRAQRRAPMSTVAAAGAGATGFFVAGLVAFPVPEVDAVAWLFAGMALAGAGATPSRPSGRRLAAAVPIALLALTTVSAVTHVAADRHLGDALDLRDAGAIAEARDAAGRATSLRPDDLDAWWVAATLAASGPTILDLDAGLDLVRRGLDRSPDDPALRTLGVQLLADRAVRSQLPVDRRRAELAGAELLADDPTNPVARAALGELGTAAASRACLARCDATS